MEQIERIRHYETLLDRIAPVLENLEGALEAFDGIQEDVKELSAYYESDEWRDDFEADEAGKLPKDLKRGVLSEDGIYDVLSEHYALTVRLLDTVSTILKNR
jgi:hypothetical protein